MRQDRLGLTAKGPSMKSNQHQGSWSVQSVTHDDGRRAIALWRGKALMAASPALGRPTMRFSASAAGSCGCNLPGRSTPRSSRSFVICHRQDAGLSACRGSNSSTPANPMIRFLNPEFLWLLALLPLLALWRGRKGRVAAVEYSNVEIARAVARETRSRPGPLDHHAPAARGRRCSFLALPGRNGARAARKSRRAAWT